MTLLDIVLLFVNFLFRIFMSVRNTCADWCRGVEPTDDPCLKGKKDPSEGYQIKLTRKTTGPSTTQVEMFF